MALSPFALIGILFAAYVVFLAIFYGIVRGALLKSKEKKSEPSPVSTSE